MTKKRWTVLISVVVLLCVSLFVAQRIRARRAEQRRQLDYQAQLKEYSNALKPGMTRAEVEAYLRFNKVAFRPWCCLGGKDASDELVSIGKEKAPWYCSQRNVDVALVFAAAKPRVVADAGDSDKLIKVTLWDHLEGCL